MKAKIIKLKCESDNPRFDQSIKEIQVDRETEKAWFGKPLANPACPVLEWPKFAWKEVVFCDAPSDLERIRLTHAGEHQEA